MTGRGRWAGAVTAAALLASAGCSSGHTSSPGAKSSRAALAASVLHVVSGNGIPVEDDHVDCSGSPDGRSDLCLGLTSSEPVQRIKADFTASDSGGDTSGSCPGTLTVTLGPPIGYLDNRGPVETLAKVAEDPCR